MHYGNCTSLVLCNKIRTYSKNCNPLSSKRVLKEEIWIWIWFVSTLFFLKVLTSIAALAPRPNTCLCTNLCTASPAPAQTRSSSGSSTGSPPALPPRTPRRLPSSEAGHSPPAALGSPPPASWSRRASPWWRAPGCECCPCCRWCAASTTASRTPADSRAGGAHGAAGASTCLLPGFIGASSVVRLNLSPDLAPAADYVACHHLRSSKGSGDQRAFRTQWMFY